MRLPHCGVACHGRGSVAMCLQLNSVNTKSVLHEFRNTRLWEEFYFGDSFVDTDDASEFGVFSAVLSPLLSSSRISLSLWRNLRD